MPSSNTLTTPREGVQCAVEGAVGSDQRAAFSVPALELLARESIESLSDDALMALQSELAELRRRTDANLALLADDIARRSHYELGHSGLAQRLGSRTPENLVQRLTGTSGRDAAALVRVGSMMAGRAASGAAGGGDADSESAGGDPSSAGTSASASPWLRDVVDAVSTSLLSVEAADVIGRGLGRPDDLITVAQLAEAATALVAEASVLTIEQLAVRARQARALLDLEAEPSRIAEREQTLRARRFLRLSRQDDGMTRLNALLDPASAALVRDAVDAATSPRRGGPRFVDAGERDRAERMLHDSRTTDQLALDAVVELIRLGGAVAPSAVIGVRAPAVQVIVAERDLRSGHGLARFEGQSEPVSVATAASHACASGVVPIVIDDSGNVLALGRQTRLFTRRQRIALAARDGGCRFPGCERPPSWAEAHHIIPWSEGGATDVSNAVLLCRHHHLLLHNNQWQLTRIDGALHVVPPPDIDAEQRPIPAPSKSPTLARAG
ncbi:MAG: DUF222 domain-containing protein [Microcella sp.]|uniref:HNH endonuclease signature motif containing protein n=1 Tax=Microcella sp. TaxID=1913979 RepID=UPI0024C9B5EB|nr:HNH endonuclease signature motif containing protein [Microcella sp.]UYN84747.1 MAG: DUF222 domain-containing protein [Microcella sp.]